MEENKEQYQRTLIERYSLARRKKEDLETELKPVNVELAELTDEIVRYMTDASLKTVKYDDLGSVTMKAPTPRPKYAKEDEEKVFEFLRANGAESLIKETVHSSSFSSFVREILSEGKDIPQFIQVFYQPTLQFKRA